jgi:cysteine desulfurase
MVAWLEESGRNGFGDPGRIHSEGMRSRVELENARGQVAAFVGARTREIVFTSGTTESIAAATWGAVERAVTSGGCPHIVMSAVEHSAVRRSAESFGAASGGTVTTVGVDPHGRIMPDEILGAVTSGTSLVHVQWGNHEVGTLQPVTEIVEGCHRLGVLVHVDASQAVGHVPVDLTELGADLVSFSGHRFGGPVGAGVLYVRRGLRLESLLSGGDQERARRAGLENILACIGLGAATAALTDVQIADEQQRARLQIERLVAAVTTIPGVVHLGDPDPVGRLPQIACFAIEGVEPQGVLLGLDQRGVAAHSGSACASEGLEPSPVLEAMGVDAHRSLRLSVGWDTLDADIEAVVGNLPSIIGSLRALTG